MAQHKGNKNKMLVEPLFPSFVFVYISVEEMDTIKNIRSVVNFVYWMGNPAIIREVELESVQQFTNQHLNINLLKAPINTNFLRVAGKPSVAENNESFITSENKPVSKLFLPSLGYIMIAGIEKSVDTIAVNNFERIKMVF